MATDPNAPALAIDIGGTKIAAGIVSRAGDVIFAAKVPTPVTADAEELFALLADLVVRVQAEVAEEIAVCGVGCGGPMTSAGTAVSPLNIPAWRGFPLRARLAALVDVPTFIDNDAKALAVGEGWVGAAAGARNYIGMVVSTGVGGGIVLEGRLLNGASGNAGHIGHVIVEPAGRQCVCGARGCLEAEASGTAIALATGKPAAEASPDVVARTGTIVGRAIGSIANLLDLQLAVVSGAVALGFGSPFFAAAQAECNAVTGLEFSRGTRVVPGALGAQGPLVGAAAVGYRGRDG